MYKVEVINGWFYVDGKFIAPFDFGDRYTYNITNKLIGEDTRYLSSKHDLNDRLDKIRSILPLEAVYFNTDNNSIESVRIDRVELRGKECRFQIISNDEADEFWLTRDLNGFFDPIDLLKMQNYRLKNILTNLYKENYDLNIEKAYINKLFGDFKDRGFGVTNAE